MPNRRSSLIAGAPVTPECSSGAEATAEAPDDPDQRSRGFFARFSDRVFPPTALLRFLGYVRPHLWLVAGGSVMGILKFTLPLAFPLAFKYVFDVLLVPQPRLERVNQMIDRLCTSIAATLRFGSGSAAKLEALTAALFVLFLVQAIATYYRTYWANMAGHRLIFDLCYALYLHMQRLSHSFFHRPTSSAGVVRFTSDFLIAPNFLCEAVITSSKWRVE